jgi:hypothetical protein
MHIELHRTFRELLLKERVDDARSLFPGHATLTLPELLDELRVVILSEGGTGKTQEIREAARRLRSEGKAAFFLRLEHVANDFDSAFEVGDLQEFQAWLASPDPGWLLLDSIDESRLRSPLDFEAAMRKVSVRLSQAKQRTHLLVTGRTAAWRPKTDLDFCNGLFPVADERTAGPEDAKGGQTTATGVPTKSDFKIVTLQDLSPDQIKLFAIAKGIRDTQAFLDGIERADAWSFTARPQDLIELTEYWLDNDRIGSRLELMKNSVKRRLHETSQERAEAHPLTNDKALEGAQIIAAALVLTHVQNISVPDGNKGTQGLDLRDLLKGWSPTDVSTLLQRPLFEPDIYSTVRFHHRSVKEYLAAQWFLKLLSQEVSRRRVEELFFRAQYGLDVVVPSMRPLLPWLAMADNRILAKVRRIAPEIVFEGGDPVQLPVDVRRDMLEQVCDQLASGASRRSMADFSAIQRFAASDLTDTLRRLVKKYGANEDIVFFLMRMVWQGRLGGARPEVMDIARSPIAGHASRIAAFRAIAEVGALDDMASIREGFAKEGMELNRKCMAELVSHIVHPDGQTLNWFLDCIPRLAKYNQYEGTGLSEEMASFFERADVALVASAIDRLHALLVKPPVIERLYYEISHRYQWLRQCVGVAVRRLINAGDTAALKPSSLVVLHALQRDEPYNMSAFDMKKLGLAELVQNWPALKWALFWHVVERERKGKSKKGERVVDAWMALVVATYVSFDGNDFDGAVQAIVERPLPDDREVALTLAFRLYQQTDRQPVRAAQLKRSVSADGPLKARLAGLMKPPKKDAAWRQMERENSRWSRKAKAQSASVEKARLEAPAKLEAQLDTLRDTGFRNPSAVSQSQYYLFDRMRALDENNGSRWTNADWRGLEREFGTKTPLAFRDGIVRFWRRYAPKLASEGAMLNSTPLADLFGLAGLTIEATENPGLFWSLTSAEAALAFRYAMKELNGFPLWFPALSVAYPDVVKSMALAEIMYELEVDQVDNLSQYLLADLSRVGDWLWDMVAPDIVKLLRRHPPKSIPRLEQMVDIVLASKLPDATVAALSAEKLASVGDPNQLALWAATWTGVDPDPAIDAVEAHLAGVSDAKKRTVFAMSYVTHLLGSRNGSSRVRSAFRTPAVLRRLYILVHKHVRYREDVDRSNKGVYSPGLRDNAQDARERLVSILSEIPGRDAYLALKAISEHHPDPSARPWFTLRARSKAEADSERTVWTAEQVCQFDKEYERTPANHRELFDLAVLRLLDLKHELEDSNESTATVVIKAQPETVLRNWIGVWCNDRSRGRYLIPQELELPDAKRPDLWWTCTGFNGPVPTELKIADNWSGPKLFERLERQLAGDYLRDDASSRGVYLLVWRGVQRRWQLPGGKWVNFGGLVDALQGHWVLVANAHPHVEEIKVIGIDLTKRTGTPVLAKKPTKKPAAAEKAAAKGSIAEPKLGKKTPVAKAPPLKSKVKAATGNKTSAKKAAKPTAGKGVAGKKAPAKK